MKSIDHIKSLLANKRYYYVYSLLTLCLTLTLTSITSDEFQFPLSSFSVLGNPKNDLFMLYNLGFLLSVVLIAVYVRFITQKVFKNSELFRLSFIIPIASIILIALFPQQDGKELHGIVIYVNLIVFFVMAPVNLVALWRTSQKLFFTIVGIGFIFVNLLVWILLFLPFDSNELGVMESALVLFVVSVCFTLDSFVYRKSY